MAAWFSFKPTRKSHLKLLRTGLIDGLNEAWEQRVMETCLGEHLMGTPTKQSRKRVEPPMFLMMRRPRFRRPIDR
jgi:hypothetical protein